MEDRLGVVNRTASLFTLHTHGLLGRCENVFNLLYLHDLWFGLIRFNSEVATGTIKAFVLEAGVLLVRAIETHDLWLVLSN